MLLRDGCPWLSFCVSTSQAGGWLGVTRLPGYDGSLALGVRQFEQECQLAFGLIHSRGDSLAWSAEGCSTGAWNDWASSVKDLQPTLKAELGIYVADLRV